MTFKGLPHITNENFVSCSFITCGPWDPKNKEWFKNDLTKWCCQNFPNVSRITVGAELGSDRKGDWDAGYYHLHAAIQHKRIRPFSLKFQLLKHMQDTWHLADGETRHFNVDLHFVPVTEKGKEGYSNYEHVLVKYLRNPSKNKEVDDTVVSSDELPFGIKGSWTHQCLMSEKAFIKLDERKKRLFLNEAIIKRKMKCWWDVDPWIKKVLCTVH